MHPHQTVAINVQIFAGGGRITIIVAKENDG